VAVSQSLQHLSDPNSVALKEEARSSSEMMEQSCYSKSHNKSEGHPLSDIRRDSLNTCEEVRVWLHECDKEKDRNAEKKICLT
jgi:hypothetical protein